MPDRFFPCLASPRVWQVFEAMISWIKHDKPARLEHMPKLMEHVRLPLLSRDYLVQVRLTWIASCALSGSEASRLQPRLGASECVSEENGDRKAKARQGVEGSFAERLPTMLSLLCTHTRAHTRTHKHTHTYTQIEREEVGTTDSTQSLRVSCLWLLLLVK